MQGIKNRQLMVFKNSSCFYRSFSRESAFQGPILERVSEIELSEIVIIYNSLMIRDFYFSLLIGTYLADMLELGEGEVR